MNSGIVILYSLIIILSSVTLTFVIKYLKDKLSKKTVVRDQILIDLALWAWIFVGHLATVIIAREIFGQFQSSLFVDSVYYIQQSIFECLLVCIVSLQLYQVLRIFQTAIWGEIRDEHVIRFHRLFVLSFGLFFGILACHSGGGICRSTSIYYYLLQATNIKEEFEDSILSVISVLVFSAIITLCQIVVEIKRFLMNREEEKAERIAVLALKEMQKVRIKMKRGATLELGVSIPPADVQPALMNRAKLYTEEKGQSLHTNIVKLPKQQVVFSQQILEKCAFLQKK